MSTVCLSSPSSEDVALTDEGDVDAPLLRVCIMACRGNHKPHTTP
jgi:hypothetical protein